MSKTNFFLNSSEILVLSLLNNKKFCYNQEEMSRAIGCSPQSISYVISKLIEKNIVDNYKGFLSVNQSKLIEELTDYADYFLGGEVFFQEKFLKVKNCSAELYAFFSNYFRIFNIDYVLSECKSLNEICFVFNEIFINVDDLF